MCILPLLWVCPLIVGSGLPIEIGGDSNIVRSAVVPISTVLLIDPTIFSLRSIFSCRLITLLSYLGLNVC